MKNIGPAKSASSIICSSTRRRGLRTVKDLSRICWKLMPSSRIIEQLMFRIAYIQKNKQTRLRVMEVLPLLRLSQMLSTILPGFECCRRTRVAEWPLGLENRDLFLQRHSIPVAGHKTAAAPGAAGVDSRWRRRHRGCGLAATLRCGLRSASTCPLITFFSCLVFGPTFSFLQSW